MKKKKQCAEKRLLEYIYRNIKYPRQARWNGVQGMVVISFVVEKDGSISETKILKDVRGGCGAESVRIVNSMPTWIPGTQRGKPVKVLFNLPILFKLEG